MKNEPTAGGLPLAAGTSPSRILLAISQRCPQFSVVFIGRVGPLTTSHMKAQKIKCYDAPHQFEPLLPEERTMEPLLERASDLTRAATSLGASAAAPAQRELRVLLRSMNSYYTNRIEGEHTRPSDIDRPLQNDFSSNA